MIEPPPSETYERELEYMPYKKSLQRVIDIVCSEAEDKAQVLDLMCGPGYLIGQLNSRRKDLSFLGIDRDRGYIEHARRNYKRQSPGSIISYEIAEVLTWLNGNNKIPWDIVLCTGALHHIPYEKQEEIIKGISLMIEENGFAIVSDCYIDDYSSEVERKIAAAKLGYEYLAETIKNGAPNDVVEATADILTNDVMMLEFKTSLHRRMPQFQRHFRAPEIEQTWPVQRKLNLAETDSSKRGYGDYIAILRK